MMRLRLFLVALGLFVLGTAAASAQSCNELDLDAAVDRGRELTTLLQIANFRADVKYMGEVAGDLDEFLAGCGTEEAGRLAQVCNYDCHLQLGRYSLFLASDLPFLSASGGISRNDSPPSPQKMQEFAVRGLQDVERGLRLLARQQAASGGSEAEAEASYREFARQLVLLNSLKVRLLTSMGDTWYQTVSEARVKQLDFAIAQAVGGGGAGVESQPNLSKALTNYEAALWTLVETKMDIPGESTYDDLRADLLVLEEELAARLDSVKKGFLFVGIDPLQFTTIKFEQLEAKIRETRAELDVIERSVEAIVERWHANKDGEATRQIDEERTIRGQQINLIAHRIGKLELEADAFANTVQQEVNKVDAERDSFNFRQQIRRLEMELATKMAEFTSRRKQIDTRRELDLIVLSKEAEMDRRNELRWLLSWEMTRMNIDMQIDSIRAQIDEYNRQRDRNQSQREDIRIGIAQKEETIRISENAIRRAELQKEQIAQRRTVTYGLRRKVSREDLCRLEKELGFVGAAPAQIFVPLDGEEACPASAPAFTQAEYVRRMCGDGTEPGLREKLNREQIRARAFVLQCVVGDTDFSDLSEMVGNDQIVVNGLADNPTLPEGVTVDCGAFTETETDFAKKIWESEIASIEKEAADLAAQRDEINAQIKHFEDWNAGFLKTIQYIQMGVTAAEGLAAALSTVPEQTVAAAGLASGVYATIKLDKPALVALDAIRQVLDTTLKIGALEANTEAQIKALTRQLTAVRQANEQIEFTKALKAVALHRTHFQLAGRRAEGMNAIKELVLQDSIADVDCQSQALNIEARVATLRAEHARQLAALELQANENALLDFDAAEQDLLIERSRSEIAIARQDIERLQLSDAQLAGDTAVLDRMVADAEARLLRVGEVGAQVTQLADASQASTNIINELRERQQQSMLALSDEEMRALEERIAQEKSNTTELVAGLDQAMALGLKSRELQASILAFQGDIKAEVQKQQEEVGALVSRIDDPALRRNLFIAGQETLSELLKGIPEYVASKRRLLETANLNLHLMRRRYALVAGVTGAREDWPSTYVRNATQLAVLVNSIADKRFFDERPVEVGVAQVVIPANSGFARSLAQSGEVSFEVSPAAFDEGEMARLGYFSLWNAAKFKQARNMTLIDIVVGAQFTCTGTQRDGFVLSHDGSGMVFRPLVPGSTETVAELQIGPARIDQQNFIDVATSQDRLDRILDFWEERFQVRQFPPPVGPPNDPSSTLPYLGAPVIGPYELRLLPSSCGAEGTVYTLYFIYSSAT
ncbi:MAG TPA: hypothetical protein VGN97_00610 [Mesorhizobium sp.]|jgi:hypothetical protein|nr:hypothetical protein [Mesorhizobium sp.]